VTCFLARARIGCPRQGNPEILSRFALGFNETAAWSDSSTTSDVSFGHVVVSSLDSIHEANPHPWEET
jgi:hypothetical protein